MLVEILLEDCPFLVSSFFILLLTGVFKRECTILSKRLRIVTILGWFSNFAIINSVFVSKEEVGGRFS